jgi:hypothetical protein
MTKECDRQAKVQKEKPLGGGPCMANDSLYYQSAKEYQFHKKQIVGCVTVLLI